jgi:HlyD family secretion protein
MTERSSGKWWLAAVSLLVIAGLAAFGWLRLHNSAIPEGIASGNGRLEATQVDIATKLPGRVAEVLVHEGDFLEAGQVVARMDSQSLQAELKQAKAETQKARNERISATALIEQRRSEHQLARKDYERSRNLFADDAIASKQVDADRTRMETTRAILTEAEAKRQESDAEIETRMAKAEKIQVDIADSMLATPLAGRVLYRLAEPGEVLAAGGKILTVLDLTDVYMTIFLPTAQALRLRIGADARLVFDALPDLAVPASVSFVAPEAQFTPKEVETRTEREKLMFRIKVKIDPELLMKHLAAVKTGVPGVAYVRLDPQAEWPEDIKRRALP